MEIKPEILDELIKGYKTPADLLGEDALLKQLTKALLERAMAAELTHELGYEKHDQAEKPTSNRRSGSSAKGISSKPGEMQIAVARDRKGEFEPQIIKRHQRRFDGFDSLILSLYSRASFDARDSVSSRGDLWRGSVARSGFNGHFGGRRACS